MFVCNKGVYQRDYGRAAAAIQQKQQLETHRKQHPDGETLKKERRKDRNGTKVDNNNNNKDGS